jgi:iron(III) transport system permease protein
MSGASAAIAADKPNGAAPAAAGRSGRRASIAWGFGALALSLLVLSPVVSLVIAAAQGAGELWPHLLAHVLPQAVRETALLLAGVGLLVVCLGVGAAWLVTAYEFHRQIPHDS